jgi:peptidyl-prolyl cis-trans isomerase A (cyclophilin A)
MTMAKRRRPQTSSLKDLESAIEDTSEDRSSRSRGGDDGRTPKGRRAQRIARIEAERKARQQRLLSIVAILVAIVVTVAAVAIVYKYMTDEDPDGDGNGNGNGNGGNPIAVIVTNHGTIEVELYMDECPETAGNFKKLVNQGFYDGLIFHRVIYDFMIQGGDPEGTGTGGPGYTIPDEPSALALSHVQGVISMANSGPDTGGSQFFIVTSANPQTHLDGKHAVFGRVVKGLDVAIEISSVPTNNQDKPIQSVVMKDVYIKSVPATG